LAALEPVISSEPSKGSGNPGEQCSVKTLGWLGSLGVILSITDSWDYFGKRSLHEWLIFDSKCIGKYTVQVPWMVSGIPTLYDDVFGCTIDWSLVTMQLSPPGRHVEVTVTDVTET